QFTDVIVVSPQSNMSVCVTGTDGNGCESTDCIEIILHENPEIIVSGDTDVCMGSSTTLQAAGGVFYQWSTGSTASTINYSPLADANVCVTGEDQFGCSSETCVQINLLPIPQLILNGDAVACVNDVAEVTAEGAESYAWSTGDFGASISVEVTDTMEIGVIGTASNGCTAETSWGILAYENPVIELTGNTQACQGTSIYLTASGAETFIWNDDFVSEAFVLDIEFDSTITVAGTDLNGCVTTLTVDLTVFETEPVVIEGIEDVCPGEILTLTATGAIDYAWSNSSSGDTVDYILNENTTIWVTGTDINGCDVTAEADITVLTGENVDITGDLTVCPGDTIIATINGLENPVWDNDTLGLMTYYALAESGPISVTGINSKGCLMTYAESAIINPLPDLAIEGDLTLCTGESTTLEATGASQYFWSIDEVDAVIEVTPAADLILTLDGISDFGCASQITVVVEVNDFTAINFELSQETICDNAGSLSLSASPTGGVFSGEGVSGSAFTPSIGMDGAQNISYTYTNEFGCTSQSTQTIVVDNCSGVDEKESFSFVLYPNPAEDRLTITSDAQGAYTLMIVNAHGQLVRNLSMSSSMSVIDITDLSAGVYEMVLMQNGEMIAKRFVKG
ncbi:MAG: T9SS type A sorting domain-containing protein, partial [Flavobacteriales bacterium]